MNQVDPQVLSELQPASIERADRELLHEYKREVERAVESAPSEASRLVREAWRVRDELGPIAYDGDPTTATVLLLKANPSYGEGATRATHFQQHPDWPLSVAGPHVTEGTRAYYHNDVFGSLRKQGVTLEQISRRMLKVELFPWASKKWPTNQERLLDLLSKFPSRRPTYALVSQLVGQGVIVLIARAENEWFKGVPQLRALLGDRVFVSRTKIGPAISDGMYPGSWDAVLRALRS
jgi:hypothetical protein